ncbi:MAG: sugar ABC transporter permease [Spirochaetaceae bacterium]|nr:sugar ABC transporter permease [Spirochaetaceae bacterium]
MNRSRTRNALAAYLFLAPAIIGLVCYTFLPIAGVVGMSLTRWDALSRPVFVGLSNFKEIFTDDMFFASSVKATVYFALFTVLLGTVYALAMALLLNQKILGRGFFRSIFFLPYIVPSIGAVIVWMWMYEANFGVFNYLLGLIGIDRIRWLGEDATATPALGLMTIWGFGNFIVIYLAGLQGIPRTYLEAVEIDGGNAWHKIRHVTLPLLSPVILFNVLTSIVANLQVFVPAQATRGAPNMTTLYMVYNIFRTGFQNNRFGYSASLSLVFFVLIAAVTAITYASSRKWMFYEGE